ncbi:patatin-like phospholipase family protein [Deinococcus sp. SM5_A1]|uniref:patatin-like phospholipase family protein n=1 Tax=Deinococcus sp. SM5_A1 TaxID=3379094 RepID=UPI00385EAC25
MTIERALVLGGGGVTGIAWGLGFLIGLLDEGLDLRDADLIVGTSAGSSVGAQITGGMPLEQLYARQLEPSSEQAVTFDAEAMGRTFAAIMHEVGPNPTAIRKRIGQMALSAPSVPEAERRAIIASRLPNPEWPAQRLVIVAVDAETGEPRFFDRDADVPLTDAVAASCAVPGVWPPVTIGDHRYMDGGVHSVTNADLAQGAQRVLVLSLLKLDAQSPLPGEVAALAGGGSAVLVAEPDAASVEAIGPNVLDPARRAGTAQAGRQQGRRQAAELKAFWMGNEKP